MTAAKKKRRTSRMARCAACSKLDLLLGRFCYSRSCLSSEDVRSREHWSSGCCKVIFQETGESQRFPGCDVTELSDRAAERCKRTSLRVHGGNAITGEERI